MERQLIEKAAKYIFNCRIKGKIFNSIPEDCIPATEEEAYLIQFCLHRMFDIEFQDKIIGIKIGCTTQVMQDYLKIRNPCAGRIRSSKCFTTNSKILFESLIKPGVECELAVSLSSDLYYEKDISEKKILNSVDKIFAAIEIVDDRYYEWEKLSANQLISDDFFSYGCVIGSSVPIKNVKNLKKIVGNMYINDKKVGYGTGKDILGNPLYALKWLIQRKDIIGSYIPAGTIVLLGSLVQTKWLKKGDEVKIIIKDIGETKVKFC